MINGFVIKKYLALFLACFIPTMGMAIGTMFYNYWIGLACFGVCSIVSIICAVVILKNPFSLMVEGKGLLVINLDSTGVIKPFIVGIKQPYITGKLDGQDVTDVYNREAVQQLTTPVKAGTAEVQDDGSLKLTITAAEFNKSRFGLYQYPTLIWNNQIKSFLTKDFLSEQEKQAFAEHGVLYLNRKMEELTSIVRDFARYVVELLKPKESLFKNKWVIIIGIILVAGLLLLLGKPLIAQFMGSGQSAVQAAVTPAKAAVSPIIGG